MINVIFDVDGTLVDSYDADTQLYYRAVDEVLGPATIRDDWADYTHVTDAGILAEIFQDNEIAPEPRLERQVRERFGTLVMSALTGRPCRSLPGALDAMRQLHGAQDVAVGVATGGWSHTARAKLNAAGFGTERWVLASSDDHPERTVIMQSCRARLPEPRAKTVYFGDGPWDQSACSSLGWAFVGVGSRLKDTAPVWIENYAACDLDEIINAALDGNGGPN